MRTGKQKIIHLDLSTRTDDSHPFRVPDGWRVVSMAPVQNNYSRSVYVVIEQVIAEDRL